MKRCVVILPGDSRRHFATFLGYLQPKAADDRPDAVVQLDGAVYLMALHSSRVLVLE